MDEGTEAEHKMPMYPQTSDGKKAALDFILLLRKRPSALVYSRIHSLSHSFIPLLNHTFIGMLLWGLES